MPISSPTSSSRRIRGAMLATVLAVAALPLAATAAAAAAPAVTLVAPVSGATGVPTGASLQVRPTDADGGSLDVRFHAAARTPGAPNQAAPFTFLTIPDTQNYVSTGALNAIMGAQTQWIVDHRTDLNLAFVTQLGDLVNTYDNTTHWTKASQYMATLDQAGVPNTVLPGNHDLNLSTGDGPLYDQYFPVSRYAGASWNSPTASYGGYLGQDLFGADPIDRKNKDNFALFTAGGMDFLLLNLEFNAPDYTLDWAKKVLAAYPDRRAILATHSYLHYNGQLTTQIARTDPGANSGVDIWNELVKDNCSIFFVVNGHFSVGDLGEARRTDTNSCGKPVLEVLTDYQDRANGGNGWLRYYTFDPAADQIRATTYSPYLDQYETDADSQFTMPYDMALPPVLPQVGAATVASGATASAAGPAVPPGTVVDWYVTVSDGTSTVRSATWTYTTATGGAQQLAADAFGRTVANGWGSADVGGSWTVSGATNRYAVGSGVGQHLTPPGATLTSTLGTVPSTATDLRATMALDRIPSSTTYLTVSGRVAGGSDYGAQVKVLNTGAVQLNVERGGTVLAGGAVSGLTLAAAQKLALRLQVDGTNPTTIRARVWKDGTTEPTGWQFTATDSTAALQTTGGIRYATYLSSSATGGTLAVRYDDLAVTAIGGVPPANQPPVAAFSSSSTDLTASLNSTASTDPDGTIVSRSWNFGDGTPAGSAATTSHTYLAAGTYQVTLTVTDDDGATASLTKPVTVTAPAGPVVLAADTFTRTVSGGWGTADTGGGWTASGTASRYSVGSGTGVFTIPAGATVAVALGGVSSMATDVSSTLSLAAVPNGTTYTTVSGRVVGTADYGVNAKVSSTGAVTLQLERSGTVLAGGTLTGVTMTAGSQLRIRLQVEGTSPTTLRAKAWPVGSTEPAAWHYTATDSTAGLQAAGGLKITTYLSSSTTNGPAVVRWDDLSATRLN